MIEKIKRFISHLDRKSFVLYKNVLQSLGVKGLAIIVSLINMPVFMDYFSDAVVLGLWFTLLSMLNWILTFDLGIGNGLRNYLVDAFENEDNNECRRLISSSYCTVGVLAGVLSILTFFLVPAIDWNAVCNVSKDIVSPEILIRTLRILLIGIWVQFLLKLINSILYAMQKSAVPNFLLLIANLLLLLSTFVLRTDDIQLNLLRLSNAYIFTSTIPMLVATIVVFRTRLRNIGIRISCWTKQHTKMVVGLGLSFLFLQLLSMASFNTREFYIMRFVEPSGVVEYQVYHKIFSLISTFFVLATTPFWSAITQALAQKDIVWIQQTYHKGLKLFALFSAGSVIVISFAQFLVNIWLSDKAIKINSWYSFLFAIINIEYMWINLHSHFENGMGKLRIQKIGYVISTFCIPMISYVLTNMSKLWVMVLIANIIALLPLSIMQPVYLHKNISAFSKVNQICKEN